MDHVERCGRFLSEMEAKTLYQHGFTFAESYMRLALLCIRKCKLRWHFTTKLHVMVRHLLTESLRSRVNFRTFHCFIES